jgi:hypothetical protein
LSYFTRGILVRAIEIILGSRVSLSFLIILDHQKTPKPQNHNGYGQASSASVAPVKN